jgi:hypothetical protein
VNALDASREGLDDEDEDDKQPQTLADKLIFLETNMPIGDESNIEINAYVVAFITMMENIHTGKFHVKHEEVTRIDQICDRLLDQDQGKVLGFQAYTDGWKNCIKVQDSTVWRELIRFGPSIANKFRKVSAPSETCAKITSVVEKV